VGYGDYVEQITYLIFLKMADERNKAGIPSPQSSPGGRGGNGVPKQYAWSELVRLDGDACNNVHGNCNTAIPWKTWANKAAC